MLPGVARRHPARVVLLNHRCTSHAREPQNVRVGLLTFGPSEHRYGIEIISVAVACLDESLPSILRAVTRGDVPTTLWLTGDLSAATPAMPLVEISRQMVYDSGDWKDLPRGFQGVAGLLDDAAPSGAGRPGMASTGADAAGRRHGARAAPLRSASTARAGHDCSALRARRRGVAVMGMASAQARVAVTGAADARAERG